MLLRAGAVVSATGYAKAFGDRTSYAPGGTVTLVSDRGNVAVQAGAAIDVSGAASGGDSGALVVSAANGTFAAAGTLAGTAQGGYRQGSIDVDAGNLDNFSALNAALNAGGFAEVRNLRARTHDVTIAGGDTVAAHQFTLTADQGAIDVSGEIDASGGALASVALWAANNLTLRSGSAIRAAAAPDQTGKGATITLGTAAGTLDLQAESTIDFSGPQNAGAPGQLLLRAPRTANNIAISELGGRIFGAGSVVAEAVRIYSNMSIVSSATISSINTDNTAYMANAATIQSRLTALTSVQPGVELRSTGDMTVSADWNLFSATRPGNTPGVLTLRAGGDLNVNGSISDGFASVAPAAAFQPGSSWSYRLVAGADLSSASPLSVAGPASSTVAAGKGNFKLATGKLVRTGTGSIDIAAARDITLNADTSVIYTAGAPAAAVTPALTQSFQLQQTGGDIRLSAGGNINGALPANGKPQLISDWLQRSQKPTIGTIATAWWPIFGQYQQGVGALGGGNVIVDAGGNVRNLSVVSNTVGSNNGNTVAGGGNVSVRAGGDIASGIFYVAKGEGELVADGGIVSGRTGGPLAQPIATILALGDGQFDVTARNDVDLQAVFNPTVWGVTNAANTTGYQYFFTYGPNSAVHATSLSGDVNVSNDVAAVRGSASTKVAPSLSNETLLAVYPGTVTATALQGDVNIANDMTLFPSPTGTLELLADRSVHVNGVLKLSDLDPLALPRPLSPATTLQFKTTTFELSYYDPRTHAVTPIHIDDLEPARIYAATGDVTLSSFVPMFFAKPVEVSAARDISINTQLISQNLRADDVTRFSAGRDLVFPTQRDASNQLLSNDSRIVVDGPGRLDIFSGRTVDLGNSEGVITRGNLDNPFLPDAGAGIVVLAGLGKGADGMVRLPDYQMFIDTYFDPAAAAAVAHSYSAELRDYMRRTAGDQTLDADQALVAFKALDRQQQIPFIDQVFFTELKQTGRDVVHLGTTYDRGYDTIAALFPKQDYAGDIKLYFSQFKTERGGAIQMFAPGGLVNAGPGESAGRIQQAAVAARHRHRARRQCAGDGERRLPGQSVARLHIAGWRHPAVVFGRQHRRGQGREERYCRAATGYHGRRERQREDRAARHDHRRRHRRVADGARIDSGRCRSDRAEG